MKRYDACLIKKKQRAALGATHQKKKKKQLEKWKEKQGVKTKKERKKQTEKMLRCQNHPGVSAETSTLDLEFSNFFSAMNWEGGKKIFFFFLFLQSALAYYINLPTKTQTTCETWVLKLFQAEFPFRELLNQSGWETKKKKKITKIRETAAGRPRSAGQRTPAKKKKKSWSVQCWQINAAAKRPAAGELMEVVGGEGSWRRATQRINWKRKSWIVKRDQRREVWSRKTHTQLRPAPSIR